MIDAAKALPEDLEELRAFTQLLLAEFKSQALLITKLKHQLTGHNHTVIAAGQRRLSNCIWLWKRARSRRRR